jgi:serine/threonine-protein kinase
MEDARRGWLARWGATPPAVARPYLWVVAFARPAETPDDARAALEELPKYAPLPALWQIPADYAVGRTYLLAGRAEEALPYLRRAAAACDDLYVPFEHVRASLALGDALAATKDTAGACAAYRAVIDRWGAAKPRSTTVDAARAHAKGAGCAP